MRLNTIKSPNATSYYVIKDIEKNGKRSMRVVEKLGTHEELLVLELLVPGFVVEKTVQFQLVVYFQDNCIAQVVSRMGLLDQLFVHIDCQRQL